MSEHRKYIRRKFTLKQTPPCDKCLKNENVMPAGFKKHADKTKEQMWICIDCNKYFMVVRRMSGGVIKNRPLLDVKRGIFLCPNCKCPDHYDSRPRARKSERSECKKCGISWIKPLDSK